MARAFLLVMDSVGCGGAPDAAAFGDSGANTLGHIALACREGRAEQGRSGPLRLPNLAALGLGPAIRAASGLDLPELAAPLAGVWAAASEVSLGKDTPSGHWELSGVPVPWNWHYFPRTDPAIPAEVTGPLIARAGLAGTLCNAHSSGMPVLHAFGVEHIATGKPILYTSADSVLQIAAHETHFGLDRLYEVCRIAAEIVHPMRVARAIARPFVGETPESFRRTANRRDLAIPPPEPTILDRVQAAGGRTHAIGKIGDIFAHRGITTLAKGKDDMALLDATLAAMDAAGDGDLVFANYVDFDTLWGHPRDVSGYARALEAFDARLPEVTGRLRPGDLLVITADHGNDPTWPGTDHTRERVPVLVSAPGLAPRGAGLVGFADVAETIATHLGIPAGRQGGTAGASSRRRHDTIPAVSRTKSEKASQPMQHLTIVTHPLVQHKLGIMRDRETSTAGFRRLLREISLLLAYEVTRDLPLATTTIETPLTEMEAPVLRGKKLALISILRAGNGLLDGVLELIPSARVGFIGLYRDEETLQPVKYYDKVPGDLGERVTIALDPMLATGNSSVAAISLLKDKGASDIRFLCLLAAPEGVARMREAHPDVPIVTAALDKRLNEKGYIVPGLGDAGDRMFGTK